MPRVHHIDLKSVALQDLEKGDPINACRLHNDGLYSARLQPLRHAMQVRREASERSHWLGVSPIGNRNIMIGITNINPGRVPIQRGESFVPLSLDLLSRLRCFCHFETSSLKSDEARPGRSRFENVSNGVELAVLRRDATKSLTAHHRNHG